MAEEAKTTYVYMHLPQGPVPAGFLRFYPGRDAHAFFRYGDRYIQRRDRVPVDPIMLPLPEEPGESRWLATPEGFPLFGGLRDAVPDGWGQHLLQTASGQSPLDEFDFLVAAADDRVGALATGSDATSGPHRQRPPGWQGPSDGSPLAGEYLDLATMQEAAERLDRQDRLDDLDAGQLRFLFRGSSLGGARPKASTCHEGRPWIAKFARTDDRYNIPRVEYGAMRLAQECGLEVPRVTVVRVPGRDIYLVERFDREEMPTGEDFRRIPYVSGLTLLGAHEMEAHYHSYRDLAEALRRYGSRPRSDCRELFRRMVFNILVTNDDDHLRNHGFLFDGRGWKLAPAFDVVPVPRLGHDRWQALGIGTEGRKATLANALSKAGAFGLEKEEAYQEVRELREQVANRWEPVFQDSGIEAEGRRQMEAAFAPTRAPMPDPGD